MGTASKALSLLNYFSRSQPTIGLSDMARLSGMNKATVHRLLTEMSQHGFVEQVGAGREYRLGPAFLRLAALRETTVPMREMAMQTLEGLSTTTGETAHMSLLNGNVLSSFAYTYSNAHGTMVMMEDAEVLDLHATGSGLAVLAYSAADFVDEVLSRPLKQRTSETETDPQMVRAALPEIRKNGFAVSIGGYEEDVHSFAVPVFDAASQCIGAVAVATPVSRMTDDLQTLIRTELPIRTTELTRLLGGFPPDTFPTFLRDETAQTGG
ncbi:IclR family transcriptional regulator [Aliiroseovarius crassostreae]|uniref:IclR family transcriptional regulator n=1 Tax=Aliiroseovarius crassostreae TaxID=154981 RepID=UPI003C7B2F47